MSRDVALSVTLQEPADTLVRFGGVLDVPSGDGLLDLGKVQKKPFLLEAIDASFLLCPAFAEAQDPCQIRFSGHLVDHRSFFIQTRSCSDRPSTSWNPSGAPRNSGSKALASSLRSITS